MARFNTAGQFQCLSQLSGQPAATVSPGTLRVAATGISEYVWVMI